MLTVKEYKELAKAGRVGNIKKGDKVKSAGAEQNLDFILSGGDYSAFVAPENPLLSEEGVGGGDSNLFFL